MGKMFSRMARNSPFRCNFEKIRMRKVHIGRLTMIRCALQSYDSDAFSNGSNFRIRHIGADIKVFKVAIQAQTVNTCQFEWTLMLRFWIYLATSKASMSAPKCRIRKFDPLLEASGTRPSSARRISVTWHIQSAISAFFWNSERNEEFQVDEVRQMLTFWA